MTESPALCPHSPRVPSGPECPFSASGLKELQMVRAIGETLGAAYGRKCIVNINIFLVTTDDARLRGSFVRRYASATRLRNRRFKGLLGIRLTRDL